MLFSYAQRNSFAKYLMCSKLRNSHTSLFIHWTYKWLSQ